MHLRPNLWHSSPFVDYEAVRVICADRQLIGEAPLFILGYICCLQGNGQSAYEQGALRSLDSFLRSHGATDCYRLWSSPCSSALGSHWPTECYKISSCQSSFSRWQCSTAAGRACRYLQPVGCTNKCPVHAGAGPHAVSI